MFQVRFADIAAKRKLMDTSLLANVSKLLVVESSYDRIVDTTMSPVDQLPKALFVTLPTDHVSVTELPERVAEELRYLLIS